MPFERQQYSENRPSRWYAFYFVELRLLTHCGHSHQGRVWVRNGRSRGARKLAEQTGNTAPSPVIDDMPVDTRRKANWARLIQKVYEVDPLECSHCGATLRIIALIDDGNVIERILRHLDR